MALEPSPKRAIVFFDGQNLYHAARHAFGYTYPNFDPIALASAVSNAHGWELAEVRFYTGVPDREDDPFWHHFWTNKLAHLGRRGAADFASAKRAYQQDYDIISFTRTSRLPAHVRRVAVYEWHGRARLSLTQGTEHRNAWRRPSVAGIARTSRLASLPDTSAGITAVL